MGAVRHRETMTAIVIIIATVALLVLSTRYGTDSRPSGEHGRHRPNWR
jgi:hypothetical protein